MNSFDDEKQKQEEPFLEEENDDDAFSQTPYDFRAEYKERITGSVPETEEADKAFMSLRFHAIGLGILIGVLIAILASAFFFGSRENEEKAPVTITGNAEPVKERPAEPGGMEIPDQDKLVYKRMRTDDMDTKVERLFPETEQPLAPIMEEMPKPVEIPTQEGQILGAPVFVPENADQMELEVLSLKEKSMQVAVPATKPAPVVQTAAPVPAPKPAVVSSAPAKPAQVVSASLSKNAWHVQLISLPSKNGAEKAWPKILKAHSALLSGLPHDVIEAQIPGKGTFYRLRVGNFQDRNDAKALCDKLKARKQDCSLTK